MNSNLFDEFHRQVRGGKQVAVETPAGDCYTYDDLIALSARYASGLVSLGVRPGDRVAVQVEKSVWALVLYLASLRSGAVFLPLNTAYTPAETQFYLADAGPVLFVCDPSRFHALDRLAEEAGARCFTLGSDGTGTLTEAIPQQGGGFETVARAEGDLAAILYTSGTTGRSKGAMLTHGNLLSNARTLQTVWQFDDRDVLIHALPIFHTHGLFVAINITLLSGARMLFLPSFAVDDVFRLLPRATALMGVPTFYVRLLQDSRLNRQSTGHMRLFVSGSAPLLSATHQEWEARTGHAILERYGMTETNMNTSNPYHGRRAAGSVGLPLPGVSVRVADPETHEPLSCGKIGSIEVKGPNVFRGYWGMPEKTKDEFTRDGYFITGDLGQFDEEGYLSIVGRSKDLIISGGYNVYPKEVESEIDAIGGVLESAVIGLAHSDLGEAVTAVVVKRNDTAGVTAEMIADHLRERLARYKLPRQVIFLDELPRNAMGKVQKNILRDRFSELYTPTSVKIG